MDIPRKKSKNLIERLVCTKDYFGFFKTFLFQYIWGKEEENKYLQISQKWE